MRLPSATAACTAVVILALGAGAAQAAAPADYAQVARQHHSLRPARRLSLPRRGRHAGPDVQRADTAERPRDERRPVLGFQVRGIRSRHRWPGDACAGALPRGEDHPRPLRRSPRLRGEPQRRRLGRGLDTAEDRGLLLQQARFDSLVAAIDAPGLSTIGLVEHLKNFVPSQKTENVVARQTKVLLEAGPRAALSCTASTSISPGSTPT